MCFSVAQRHLPNSTSSWVDVFSSPLAEQQRPPSHLTTVSAVTAVSKGGDVLLEQARRRSTNHVGKLMLKLPWPRTQQQLEEERLIQFAALSPFTEDQNTGILESVAWGLGKDWTKVAILLGASPLCVRTLANTNTLNDGQRAMQVLEQWRNTQNPRQDRGVSELLVTLQRAGRGDLVSVVITRLRNWLKEHGVTGGPMAALLLDSGQISKPVSSTTTAAAAAAAAAADTGTNINTSDAVKDIPEPMGGEFLRGVSQELGPRFDLALDLGISKPEVETIMADPLLTSDEEKMFKLLVLSRDKTEKIEECLKNLLQTTRRRRLGASQHWILRTARRWRVLHGATDDHFAHAVGEILDSGSDGSSSV